eukprot:757317-Hanusia_phi.AAC.1
MLAFAMGGGGGGGGGLSGRNIWMGPMPGGLSGGSVGFAVGMSRMASIGELKFGRSRQIRSNGGEVVLKGSRRFQPGTVANAPERSHVILADEEHNPFMGSVFDRVDAREGETVGISYKNDFLRFLKAVLGYLSSSLFAAWLVLGCNLASLPEKVAPGVAEKLRQTTSRSLRLIVNRAKEYYMKAAIASVKGLLLPSSSSLPSPFSHPRAKILHSLAKCWYQLGPGRPGYQEAAGGRT